MWRLESRRAQAQDLQAKAFHVVPIPRVSGFQQFRLRGTRCGGCFGRELPESSIIIVVDMMVIKIIQDGERSLSSWLSLLWQYNLEPPERDQPESYEPGRMRPSASGYYATLGSCLWCTHGFSGGHSRSTPQAPNPKPLRTMSRIMGFTRPKIAPNRASQAQEAVLAVQCQSSSSLAWPSGCRLVSADSTDASGRTLVASAVRMHPGLVHLLVRRQFTSRLCTVAAVPTPEWCTGNSRARTSPALATERTRFRDTELPLQPLQNQYATSKGCHAGVRRQEDRSQQCSVCHETLELSC